MFFQKIEKITERSQNYINFVQLTFQVSWTDE